MRAILVCAAVLILGAVGILSWQQSEIAHLSAQLARQSAVPAPEDVRSPNVRPQYAVARVSPWGLSADERNYILDQYRGVLAKMNLPPATASRLEDLLTERIAAALDAQDESARYGFADGSPESTRAESYAIAHVDQEIAALVGAEADERLNWLLAGSPAPVAAPTIVVNVVTPPPVVPVEVDTAAQPEYDYTYSQPAPYYYNYGYPIASYWVGEVYSRPYVRDRFEGDRGGSRPEPRRGSGELGRRTR